MLQFGNITINAEIVENTADMVIAAIAKAVPKESLCIAVIDEILDNEKVVFTETRGEVRP